MHSSILDRDYQNRLADVVTKNGSGVATQIVHYAYNANGQRIVKQVDGNADGVWEVDERYVYDGSELLLTLDASGQVKQSYFNGIGVNDVLAEETGGTVRWVLADHENSVRDVADDSGALVDHIQYDTYGNILSETDGRAKFNLLRHRVLRAI